MVALTERMSHCFRKSCTSSCMISQLQVCQLQLELLVDILFLCVTQATDFSLTINCQLLRVYIRLEHYYSNPPARKKTLTQNPLFAACVTIG